MFFKQAIPIRNIVDRNAFAGVFEGKATVFNTFTDYSYLFAVDILVNPDIVDLFENAI